MADLVSKYLPYPIHLLHKRTLLPWLLGDESTLATAAAIAWEAIEAAGGPLTDQGALAGEVAALLERERATFDDVLGQDAVTMAEVYL